MTLQSTVYFLLQKFLKESDYNKSGDVGLNEFINYVREHEKNLQLQFSNLDKNKDGNELTIVVATILWICSFLFVGKVDLEELILAFKELGIEIDKTEATKLLERYGIAVISISFICGFLGLYFITHFYFIFFLENNMHFL